MILFATPHTAFPDEPHNVSPEYAKHLQGASESWKHFLKQHIKIGDTREQVKKVMQDRSRDWGMLALGGTGQYELLFKIDDFLQVEVTCDRHDIVSGSAIITRLRGS